MLPGKMGKGEMERVKLMEETRTVLAGGLEAWCGIWALLLPVESWTATWTATMSETQTWFADTFRSTPVTRGLPAQHQALRQQSLL